MDSALASGASGTGSTPVRRTKITRDLQAQSGFYGRISLRAIRMRQKVISVIGGHSCNREVEQISHELGKKLVKVVDVLVSGGLGGTMRAVCSGFKAGGGLTIGIISSYNKDDANPYVDIVIPTGMGLARNVLVVKSADVVIALPGSAGTLSEIAYCLQFAIPVISLNSWDIPGVIKAKTVDEAVGKVRKILKD
jgi:uncharacterized protein (TIGR00725 family)